MPDTSIWFHGTKFSRWASISQQGLLAAPADRAWEFASNPGSFRDRSLASAGGIYLSRNLMSAYGAAHNGPNAHNDSDDVLLIVKHHDDHGTGFAADEDSIGSLTQVKTPECVYCESVCVWLYTSWKFPGKTNWETRESAAYLEKARNHYRKTLDYLAQNETQKELLRAVSDEVFEIALTRATAWVIAEERGSAKWHHTWTSYLQKLGLNPAEIPVPNPHNAEWEFSQALHRASQKLGFLANPLEREGCNARSLQDIPWSQNTGIICALKIRRNPHPDAYDIEILQGQEPPEEFHAQWKERMGYDIRYTRAA